MKYAVPISISILNELLQSGEVEYLPHGGEGFKRPIARIICDDGWSISVQASSTAYAYPRNNSGPWTHVECGFPSAADDRLTEYAEDPDDLPNTVYAMVPVSLVVEVINAHGGAMVDGPHARILKSHLPRLSRSPVDW